MTIILNTKMTTKTYSRDPINVPTETVLASEPSKVKEILAQYGEMNSITGR